jgi:hypothetical protein
VKLALDALAHGVGGCRLAVGDEGRAGQHGEAFEPVQDLHRVGVGRQVIEHDHFGPHRHFFAKNAHGGFAARHPRAARAPRLKAGKQNRVAGVRRKRLEVMHHTAPGGHAAGGNDDRRAVLCVELARVLGCVHDARCVHHGLALRSTQPQLAAIFLVNPGGAYRHWAVEVNRQVRNHAPRLEQGHAVHQALRTPHRKRRNHHHAVARRRAVDHLGQPAQRVGGGVCAVTVGGLDHQVVGALDLRRRRQDEVMRAADIA